MLLFSVFREFTVDGTTFGRTRDKSGAVVEREPYVVLKVERFKAMKEKTAEAKAAYL